MTEVPCWCYWEGPTTPITELCIESIRRTHPTLCVVGPDDIRALGGDEPLSLTEGKSLAYRADLLRFWLLDQYGGVWFDADIVALRSSPLVNDLQQYAMAGFGANTPGPPFSACHFAMQRGPLASEAYAMCKTILAMKHPYYGESSQGVLGRLWRYYETHGIIRRRERYNFAKIHWQNWRQFIAPIAKTRAYWNENAATYHLTNPVSAAVAHLTREQLLSSDTFLGFLLRQSLAIKMPRP